MTSNQNKFCPDYPLHFMTFLLSQIMKRDNGDSFDINDVYERYGLPTRIIRSNGSCDDNPAKQYTRSAMETEQSEGGQGKYHLFDHVNGNILKPSSTFYGLIERKKDDPIVQDYLNLQFQF